MRGTAARVESTRASDLANSQAQIDVAVFIQWADAYASGNKLDSNQATGSFNPTLCYSGEFADFRIT